MREVIDRMREMADVARQGGGPAKIEFGCRGVGEQFVSDLDALIELAERVERSRVAEITREDWLENCEQFGPDMIGQRVRILPDNALPRQGVE